MSQIVIARLDYNHIKTKQKKKKSNSVFQMQKQKCSTFAHC